MPVVRGRGQKEAMLESRTKVTNCPRDMRVDSISLTAGGRRVVSFIHDQQASWPEGPQPVSQRRSVGFIDQKTVRDQETRVCRPGVNTETPFTPNLLHKVLIKDFEDEAEPGLKFITPLQQHRGRAGYHNLTDLLTHEQFARNESGLNGLAKTHIISNEQIDSGEK